MRICYVTNLYGALARGGAERIAEREAAAMAAAGHAVLVITAMPADASLPEMEERDGIRVVRLRPANLFFYTELHRHGLGARFAWHLVDMFDGRTARAVAEAARAFGADVVHTHNLMGLGFLVPAALRHARLRHVHTLHDVQLLHPSGLIAQEQAVPWGARAARAAYVALTRRLMGSPHVVVSPSRYLAALHARHGFFRRSRVVTVANPVPDALASAASREERRRFLFVGQLEAHKGVRELLDAWERLGGLDGGTLEIAGDGALADEVAARAAALPGVVPLGRVAGEALLAAYDRASFVVLPSTVIENAPTVIGEAFARGVPVIASAVGGVPELVQDGVHGWLCPPGRVDLLAEAIARAAGSDWQRFSAAALAAARERAMDRHRAALEAVYK